MARKWWSHECKNCSGRGTVKKTYSSKAPNCPKCGRKMTTWMDSSFQKQITKKTHKKSSKSKKYGLHGLRKFFSL